MTPQQVTLPLPDDAATTALGQRIAPLLRAGDVVFLSGPVGAGKSHLARAIIQALYAAEGHHVDVPSPTFTLVQTYDDGPVELWHADLYRLTTLEGVLELGLADLPPDAVLLVEWPDRLRAAGVTPTLGIALEPVLDGTERRAACTLAAPHFAALADG